MVVAERNSVAVEDVASMLDQILITSSNNADDVCDLHAALTTAKSDAASLRKELELLESRLAASTASEASASEQVCGMRSCLRAEKRFLYRLAGKLYTVADASHTTHLMLMRRKR